jgi:hypothetical protein
MDETLEQLIDAVEADESTQPARDAIMENIYAAIADPRLEDSWGEGFIVNGIDAFMILEAFVAARGALLDYHLNEYQEQLEDGMHRPDRTFGAG